MVSSGEEWPIPVYKRGMYFTGVSELTLDGLMLNNRFTLEFIVWPEAPGLLLEVSPTSPTLLLFYLEGNQLTMIQGIDGPVGHGNWEVSQWYIMALVFDLTDVYFYLSGDISEI